MGALPLTLLPAYPALLLGLVRRDRLLSALAAALVGAHLLLAVAPAVGARPLTPEGERAPRLRVVVANLYVLNPDPLRTARALAALRPDVLVTPELTAEGLGALRGAGVLADLPHSAVDPAEETVGLFSRLPLQDVAYVRGNGRALPVATIAVAGVPVRLVSTHTLPPVGVLEVPWRRTLGDLAGQVRATPLPVVVVGDLNADRDHGALRELLRQGLRDVHDERGRGLARTWPAGFPLLHLDHVLVRDGVRGRLEVTGVTEVRLPGTDHRAVVADLAVVP